MLPLLVCRSTAFKDTTIADVRRIMVSDFRIILLASKLSSRMVS